MTEEGKESQGDWRQLVNWTLQNKWGTTTRNQLSGSKPNSNTHGNKRTTEPRSFSLKLHLHSYFVYRHVFF